MASVLLIALAGCGGGSGGGPASPTPTPTPTVATFPGGCTATTYVPNYVSAVPLIRWPAFPLRIFFVRDTQYSLARQNLATKGFNQWVAATSNGGTYTLVTQASQANVTITFFKFTGGPGDNLGVTTDSYTPSNNQVVSAEMQLGITGTNAQDTETAAHEYGHLLGIAGHSPNPLDLMYFEANASGQITARDLNTMLTDYCGTFPTASARTSQSTEPLKKITMY